MKKFINAQLPSLDASEIFDGTIEEIIEKLTRIKNDWKENGYENIVCRLDSGYENADLKLSVNRWETDSEELYREEHDRKMRERKIQADLELYNKLKKQFDKK